jgi:hypothetical protein
MEVGKPFFVGEGRKRDPKKKHQEPTKRKSLCNKWSSFLNKNRRAETMASPWWCCYSAASAHRIVMTMLLVASFSLLSILPKPVSAVYNCSNETVVPEATDFFHHLKTSCNLLQAEVGSNSNHMMHIESIDPKFNRTLFVWADCGLEEDASYCRVIYVLLILKLPFAWVRSGWGWGVVLSLF